MKEKVKHLFFDLDRTIWDYETNSQETLLDLYDHYLKEHVKISAEEFIVIFREENAKLWDLFTENKIDKQFLRQERFYRSISKSGLNCRETGLTMEEHYLEHTPSKKTLIPDSIEVLTALSKEYKLHIITNGFEEVQHYKLRNCGLDHFFHEVITSDSANARKPNKEIFDHALVCSGAQKEDSMMIGDDPWADIQGAIDAGWEHALLVNTMNLNHDLKDIIEVSTLKELLPYLIA